MSVEVLDTAELDRFGKILGLLGSNHDGERAAAAAKATAFLDERQLGCSDVVTWPKTPPIIYQPPSSRGVERCHRGDARRCILSGIAWKPHEAKFLRQMAEQFRRPTEKQRDWLDGLLDRVVRQQGGGPHER